MQHEQGKVDNRVNQFGVRHQFQRRSIDNHDIIFGLGFFKKILEGISTQKFTRRNIGLTGTHYKQIFRNGISNGRIQRTMSRKNIAKALLTMAINYTATHVSIDQQSFLARTGKQGSEILRNK